MRRLHEKAVYDRGRVHAILDEALVAHLGFEHEGHPFVIPTLHARVGDLVYVHGSSASPLSDAAGRRARPPPVVQDARSRRCP